MFRGHRLATPERLQQIAIPVWAPQLRSAVDRSFPRHSKIAPALACGSGMFESTRFWAAASLGALISCRVRDAGWPKSAIYLRLLNRCSEQGNIRAASDIRTPTDIQSVRTG